MILEWFEYLVTPASAEAKKWGHLKQSIALRARATRQKDNWKSHLENCHQLVERFLEEKRASAKSIMILGSGHLFDIPQSIFDQQKNPQFQKIYLVDLVHPLEIRKRAQSDPRIELLEGDLAGGMPESFLVADLKKYFKNLAPLDLPSADLVISANLMSQLPLPAVQSAEKWLKHANSKDDFETLRSLIEEQMSQYHWQQLELFSRRGSSVLFWTDFEKHFYDANGEKILQESSLGNFVIPNLAGSWFWDIAPVPEISKKFGLQMKVGFGRV